MAKKWTELSDEEKTQVIRNFVIGLGLDNFNYKECREFF